MGKYERKQYGCVKKPYADWATAMTEIKRVNRNGSKVEREPYECPICADGTHHISYPSGRKKPESADKTLTVLA